MDKSIILSLLFVATRTVYATISAMFNGHWHTFAFDSASRIMISPPPPPE
ncbi:MAG: hypothetical protein LBH98_01205 [Chitinispirillales bacterium]|nr:hypothetical protein [Chitinispirillales bacterium]